MAATSAWGRGQALLGTVAATSRPLQSHPAQLACEEGAGWSSPGQGKSRACRPVQARPGKSSRAPPPCPSDCRLKESKGEGDSCTKLHQDMTGAVNVLMWGRYTAEEAEEALASHVRCGDEEPAQE